MVIKRVALLRALNVGGANLLPMAELASLCASLGLDSVRTYIQSGNVVFASPLPEPSLRTLLEQALAERMGRRIGVLIRTAAELRATIEANPFRDAEPARTGILFLHEPAPPDPIARLAPAGPEQVQAIGREIFIHYPDGMGRSKLRLPAALAEGTMRNAKTVAKLAELAGA